MENLAAVFNDFKSQIEKNPQLGSSVIKNQEIKKFYDTEKTKADVRVKDNMLELYDAKLKAANQEKDRKSQLIEESEKRERDQRARADDVERERNAFRTSCEELDANYQESKAENERLKAENEELKRQLADF